MKKMIVFIFLLGVIILLPTVVKAEASNVTFQSIRVVTPAGSYKTGEKITIEATFSGNLKSNQSIPNLDLKFGTSEDYGKVSLNTATISQNKIVYTYTIEKTDSGELKFVAFNKYKLNIKDENEKEITMPTSINLSGNKITANPLVWTTVSDLSYELKEYDGGGDVNYLLKTNSDKINKMEEHIYWVLITNSKQEPTLEYRADGKISNADSILDNNDFIIGKYLERNGDIYCWLYDEQMSYETGKYTNKLIASKKIDRPKQKELGSRMQGYFLASETSTFLYEPKDTNITRKMKLKIGKVTDKSIITAVLNKESNALAKLLNYAKSATAIYTGTVPVGNSSTITNQFDIVDKELYYVYMELDDENGTYYPVEDVSLYQGYIETDKNSKQYGKNLCDYLSDEFKYTMNEENKAPTKTNDPTVAKGTIPQTGETITILAIAFVVIVSGIIAVVKIRKNNF